MGPVPIVDLSGAGEAPFVGPRLKERLWFPETDPEETFDQVFKNSWQDNAVDLIPDVVDDLERKGEIPGVRESDRWGPPILSADHQKKVQKERRRYCLPNIEVLRYFKWVDMTDRVCLR